MSHLNKTTFGYYLLILAYHNITAITAGLFIGSLSPSPEAASAIGTPIIIIMVIFGGFYINVNALPIVANWIPYLSFIRWTFEALAINEFLGLRFSCSGSSDGACIQTGEQVLQTLGFGGHTPQPAIFGLSMVFIGFLLLLFISLEISRIKYMPLGFKGRKFKEEKNKTPAPKQVSDSTHA